MSTKKSTKPLVLYIAGPMRLYEDTNYNFPAFEAAARHLKAAKHEVVSPAQMDLDEGLAWWEGDRVVLADKFTMEDAMRRDTVAIAGCDGIVLLPNWEKSIGAQQELSYAVMTGRRVFTYLGAGEIKEESVELDQTTEVIRDEEV